MELVKTVKCKLQVTHEDREVLKETLSLYADACNDALEVALAEKILNPYTLHRKLYYVLKERCSLTANYVVRCFTRVIGAVKAAKVRGREPKLFRPTSLDLDKDLFRMKEIPAYPQSAFWVSLSTVGGRRKIQLHIGNYQRSLLTGQKPTSATLNYDSRRKRYYLNIVLSKPMPAPNPTGRKGKIVGVDLGIVNLATTSTGMKFSGRQAMHIRRRYQTLRATFQSKDTKSAKRRLRRLSGREHRWMRDVNHRISKQIVSQLQPGDLLIMEDLTHIRERIKVQRRQRLIQHSWAFGQLQAFCEYKALEKGAGVRYDNPAYSSQDCSRCGSRGIRQGHRFSCAACGHHAHADFNSPHNLVRRAELQFASADGPSSTGLSSRQFHAPCQGQADCFSCQ